MAPKINIGIFLCTSFHTASSAARPSDSTVSEDAGIEQRNVATSVVDPELFAGSGLGSGINHFGSGSGQSGSVMNLILNLSLKK